MLRLKLGFQPSTCGCQGIKSGPFYSMQVAYCCKNHPYRGQWTLTFTSWGFSACSLGIELQAIGCGLDGCSTLLLKLNSWPLSNTFSRVAFTHYLGWDGLSSSGGGVCLVSRGWSPRSRHGEVCFLPRLWGRISCRPLDQTLIDAGSLWHSVACGSIVPIFTWCCPHV